MATHHATLSAQTLANLQRENSELRQELERLTKELKSRINKGREL